MVGRPDYRLNAVLLRGIMSSSLIARSCALWINLGSCMHLDFVLKSQLCIVRKIGSTGVVCVVLPLKGTIGLVVRYYRIPVVLSVKLAVCFFQSRSFGLEVKIPLCGSTAVLERN